MRFVKMKIAYKQTEKTPEYHRYSGVFESFGLDLRKEQIPDQRSAYIFS